MPKKKIELCRSPSNENDNDKIGLARKSVGVWKRFTQLKSTERKTQLTSDFHTPKMIAKLPLIMKQIRYKFLKKN